MGWGLGTSSNWLPHLRRAGLIVCTTPSPVAKNARYRLPGELTEAARASAEQRRQEELLQHPNGQAAWRLIRERGEVTSSEVAGAGGFSQATARAWLNRLVEQGHATRHFEGIKGQHGGRRVIYSVREET
jgi:predicted HTH transcriptional regulator